MTRFFLKSTSCQGNGNVELNGQLGTVPAVSVHDDATDAHKERSLKSVTQHHHHHHLHSPSSSSSLSNGGGNPALVNGTHQPPTPNMPTVDGPVATAIAPTSTTSAAPSPTVISSTSSPITPTPSSMSFMFYQRRHPDPTNSGVRSLESSHTPEGSKEDNKGGKDDRPETKIIIPDSSTPVSTTPLSPIFNPISSSVTPTTSRPSSTSIDPNLFSNRPAPPSPALSRRVSGAPSISSSNAHSRPRSRSSRPSSLAISRANSGRVHPSTTIVPSSDPIPTAAVSSTPCSTVAPPLPAQVYIKVRDYAFVPTDDRHLGLGTDTPKANRVHRLNRKLGGPDRARARVIAAIVASSSTTGTGRPVRDSIGSVGSVDSSDVDVEEEEEEEEEGWGIGISGWGKGGGKGWDGFKMGMGRFSWTIGSSHSNIQTSDKNDKDSKGTSTTSNGIFPSRKDLDMNFMDSSSSSDDDDNDHDHARRGGRVEQQQQQQQQPITEEFFSADDDDFDETGLQTKRTNWDQDADADAEEEEEEEPLYPGLYRALYAFEPEGTAEMKLDEDQIVRVVGRGGGVGWAVVVVDDERGVVSGSGSSSSSGNGPLKHALVPEGYLEAVRLDWEDEEDEMEFADGEDIDGGGNLNAVKSGDA